MESVPVPRTKVGIVTISLNQGTYLQEAIDSAEISTSHALSYVIVDAGSGDHSREIIDRNRNRFAKTICEPDRGPADGLNKGFAACDADVLGYLNADDRFVPGALDFVASYFAAHNNIDLLLGAIRIIGPAGKPRLRGRAPDIVSAGRLVSGTCFVWQQATFFRREIFQRTRGFNIENRSCWDAELVLDLLLAGARIGYTNTILGDFRLHGESLTGSGKQAFLARGEFERLRIKAGAAGYPSRDASLGRLKYKFDPARHLRCLFGIRMPR